MAHFAQAGEVSAHLFDSDRHNGTTPASPYPLLCSNQFVGRVRYGAANGQRS